MERSTLVTVGKFPVACVEVVCLGERGRNVKNSKTHIEERGAAGWFIRMNKNERY